MGLNQGSSQEKIKRGVILRSKQICGSSDHIKEILPQKEGRGVFPALARSLGSDLRRFGLKGFD